MRASVLGSRFSFAMRGGREFYFSEAVGTAYFDDHTPTHTLSLSTTSKTSHAHRDASRLPDAAVQMLWQMRSRCHPQPGPPSRVAWWGRARAHQRNWRVKDQRCPPPRRRHELAVPDERSLRPRANVAARHSDAFACAHGAAGRTCVHHLNKSSRARYRHHATTIIRASSHDGKPTRRPFQVSRRRIRS